MELVDYCYYYCCCVVVYSIVLILFFLPSFFQLNAHAHWVRTYADRKIMRALKKAYLPVSPA
jgi:hypothetical protein